MRLTMVLMILLFTSCCHQSKDLNLDGYVDVEFEQTDELE